MLKEKLLKKEIRPFVSISIIIVTLFIAAFSKITVRRISYALYTESKKFNSLQDEYYESLQKYGQLNRSELLEKMAKKHSFHKIKKGQIIQVIDGKAAVSY